MPAQAHTAKICDSETKMGNAPEVTFVPTISLTTISMLSYSYVKYCMTDTALFI